MLPVIPASAGAVKLPAKSARAATRRVMDLNILSSLLLIRVELHAAALLSAQTMR